MNFGLFSINAYASVEPRTLARVARAAEAAGFESLWAGEHVVLPDPQAPPSPMAPTDAILDPAIALTYAAAVTTRVRLGTGIIILPQRNPLVLAKELASLDVLSGGRLTFGIGVGYLEPEFRALGAPFEDRGAVTDEYLAAMRAIWGQAKPAYQGRFVSFAAVQAHPHPVQKPHPPIVVGGRTTMAFRRAVQQGNGWYGFALDLDGTRRALDGLRDAAARHTAARRARRSRDQHHARPRRQRRSRHLRGVRGARRAPAHPHAFGSARRRRARALRRDGGQGAHRPLAPRLPVRVQPPLEISWSFPEDLTTEGPGSTFQSLSTLVDPVQQSLDDLRWTESLRITRQLTPQHGQVVILAEELPEIIRLRRERS